MSAVSSTQIGGAPVPTTTSVILPPSGRPVPTTNVPDDEPSSATTTTVVVPSSSGRPGEPTTTAVETAGAALATPVVGMGSLVAMGAAALAIMA